MENILVGLFSFVLNTNHEHAPDIKVKKYVTKYLASFLGVLWGHELEDTGELILAIFITSFVVAAVAFLAGVATHLVMLYPMVMMIVAITITVGLSVRALSGMVYTGFNKVKTTTKDHSTRITKLEKGDK